ncbi:MAG: RNA-binding S4 domain-containing protein [Chiayiivirga sp.]|uniref:Heat shock protein 15 n=1 Tax=Denitratimonas tolerans TaxID=1338420 RepID=A0AAW9R8W0_9GAMM|nr:RNA-binding S4 domain-containing protein [Xanthomonadaceae bacterium]MDX9765486.1 RNA-binding S4 domain-containing protein [Chiayiivirga sp.]HMN34847.1 RNA-binding S4 domain-containing protein [Chiayiivirga sp.]HRO86679.1 RNA-binding S4 domain-containing protein [Chiayiivirga sp.]
MSEGVRIDVWLWAARFFKTRALAKEAVTLSRVKVAGQPCKPSRAVRVGDALSIERAGETWEITVLGLSDARGPASVAQQLYREDEQSRLHREAQRALRAAERAGYRPPAHRPDKRARRLIQALGDLDAQ